MTSADDLRNRLRELGRASPHRAAPGLEARLVERLRAEGPGLVRRSRRRRALMRASAAVLPVAICAAWLGTRETGTPAETEPPSAIADAAPARTPAAPLATAPADRAPDCARRPAPAGELRALAGGRRELDLGERGRLVLEPGGAATLATADPCRLIVQLEAGRLNVHAADLLGGELRVRAGTADVVVRGTKFAVARLDTGLEVDVEEGTVGVERDGRALAAPVRAGQSLHVRASSVPVLLAMSESARQQLRAALSVELPERGEPPIDPPVTRAAAAKRAPAAKLVARADALWRSGARDEARARYREAGGATGPTAEAAWLALARRELSAGDAAAAQRALATYAKRFPSGELAAEAAGIDFRAALASQDHARAKRAARTLVERYGGTPQGIAAARWLVERGVDR